MIKVKDLQRLKAFGFDYEARNGHYCHFDDNKQACIVVDEDSKVYFIGNSEKLLDVFFDLQAAGLLERVEDSSTKLN